MKKLFVFVVPFLVLACGGAVDVPPSDDGSPSPEAPPPDVTLAPDASPPDAGAPLGCYDPLFPVAVYQCTDSNVDCSNCPASCTVVVNGNSDVGTCTPY